MKAILNSNIIDTGELKLSLDNRGFKYGDGLFETIAIPGGNPRLLELHLQRLKEGTEYLGLNMPGVLQLEMIQEGIQQLQQSNNILRDAIAKLYIWRHSGGKYAPLAHDSDVLLTLEKTTFNKVRNVPLAGFSEKVTNYPSGFSSLKTMSALKYVLAGIEKEKRQLDEIIILDHEGHISEALSSNIFWKKDDKYYTPPLSTGCISGVMRQWMMKALHQKGYMIQERAVGKAELLRADCIFTTNAAGIGHIQAIEQSYFDNDQNSQKIFEQIS